MLVSRREKVISNIYCRSEFIERERERMLIIKFIITLRTVAYTN